MNDNYAGVFDNLDKFADRTALIADDLHSVNYKEFVGISDGFGSRIPVRSLVLLVCENSIESIASYVGFIRSGIVPLLVDSNIGRELIDDIREIYCVKYICSQKLYIERCKEGHDIIYSYGKYNLAEFKVEEARPKINDELALLLPTSGSTGSPKCVRISYKNLHRNTESISMSLPIKSKDRVITTMPMSYSYGLSIVNTHLFCGASILSTNKTMMDKKFWSIFSKARITTFGGVPFIYEMLNRLKFSQMGLNTLKYITQAGGRLDPSLVEYFATSCEKMGVDFYVMYGQTEATARMSVLSSNNVSNKKDSIGQAIPGGRFLLIDDYGHEINDDTAGELIYFGDNVSMGYAEKSSDLNRGDVNKGRLRTGDIAKRDSDGFYYIIGRMNRFVKIFGVRVGLDEVENFFRAKGIECVCAGSDDNLKIYTSDPDSVTKIHDAITENRLIHHKGYLVHLIDSIPRNESGKIMYSQL